MRKRRAALLALLLLVASAADVRFAEASTAQIPGAPGNVVWWYGLEGSPRPRVTFVVTHDSWGGWGSGYNTARSQSGGRIGAEWWVMSDGTILHSDRERRTGHCDGVVPRDFPFGRGYCNELAVGIEFEGFGRLSQQQIAGGLALIRFLQERYCIRPPNIIPHRKAPNEGILMAQTAQQMAYNPNCTGTVHTTALPDGLISSAYNTGQQMPPSLQEIYSRQIGNPYQGYMPPQGYMSPQSPMSQSILGSFGQSYQPLSPSPSETGKTAAPVQTPIDTLRALSQGLSAGEGDPVTDAESKKYQALKDSDKILVVYKATTTASLSADGTSVADATSTDVVSIQSKYAVTTTFEQSHGSQQQSQTITGTTQSDAITTLLSTMKTALLKLIDVLGSMFR